MKTITLILSLLAASVASANPASSAAGAVAAMRQQSHYVAADPAPAATPVASSAATAKPGQCYTKTITVCPVKKPKKKAAPPVVVPTPPPMVVVPPLCPEPLTIEHVQYRIKNHYIYREVTRPETCPHDRDKGLINSVWGSLGIGVRDPYMSGNIGLQQEISWAYFGYRIYSALQYGVALQTLPYVFRNDRVQVHVLDPGFMVTGGPFRYLSDPDVPRKIDLLVGAGVQVKLTCHLKLTADVRTAIPDPTKLKDCVGTTGERVDARKAIGNAFAESQVLVGLLFHD